MPHGNHISAKASDMSKATMCAYPQSDHALPHWKCVLRCCAKCTCINIPDQETYNQYSDTTPSIRFHIYHIIALCTYHVIIPLKDKNIYRKCKQESSTEKSKNIYTRKQLVIIEATIYVFLTSFYIPAIQRLAFHLPMYAYLVQITVVKCDAQPSNVVNFLRCTMSS